MKGFQTIKKEAMKEFYTNGKEHAFIYLDFATFKNCLLNENQIEALYKIIDEMN